MSDVTSFFEKQCALASPIGAEFGGHGSNDSNAQPTFPMQVTVPNVIVDTFSFPVVAVPDISVQEPPLDGDLGECESTRSCVPEPGSVLPVMKDLSTLTTVSESSKPWMQHADNAERWHAFSELVAGNGGQAYGDLPFDSVGYELQHVPDTKVDLAHDDVSLGGFVSPARVSHPGGVSLMTDSPDEVPLQQSVPD